MSHNDLNYVSDDINPDISYETQDVNVRSIAYFGLGLLLLTIVAMVVAALLLTSLDNRSAEKVGDEPSALVIPPEPRLQPNPVDRTSSPEEQLHELTVKQETILNTYGWVDMEAGIARIPIDEAMKLTVAKYR